MAAHDDQTRELQDAARRLADAIRQSLDDGLTVEDVSRLVGLTPDEVREFVDET